jgi:4-diphosphocytidyl-2-C-methyl-D-erythritol kinase
VAFADVGDVVAVTPADRLSLDVTGPFGEALAGQGDNLVLRALRALGAAAGIGEPPLAVTLDKRLPIAAGLGGGSSDAAVALRLADQALALGLDETALTEVSRVIGADGPMCLRGRTAWAEGIGDVLTDAPEMPALFAVLINPGVPSPTGAVYRAYDDRGPREADRPPPPSAWAPDTVLDWLASQRNDLEPVALDLAPAIGAALDRLRRVPDLRLARMSGSGATVFGLFAAPEDARRAADQIRADHPTWWITPTTIGIPNGKASD